MRKMIPRVSQQNSNLNFSHRSLSVIFDFIAKFLLHTHYCCFFYRFFQKVLKVANQSKLKIQLQTNVSAFFANILCCCVYIFLTIWIHTHAHMQTYTKRCSKWIEWWKIQWVISEYVQNPRSRRSISGTWTLISIIIQQWTYFQSRECYTRDCSGNPSRFILVDSYFISF